MDPTRFRVCRDKPRVFIISDIANEPDDAESLVRYLTYSNEFETCGLVACTSTWMKRAVHPEDMFSIVDAFSQVVDRMNRHVHPDNQYPPAEYLKSIIRSGPVMYGKEALADGVPLSEGGALLIERLKESEKPLWVLGWGGINTLAQALQHIQRHYPAAEAAKLRSRLRVYTISDQDDTGVYIRVTFPEIFYICSLHGWNEYANATWTGISGDHVIKFDKGGPDETKVTNEWLRENIQIGPFGGKAYPTPAFSMEGDTPTFLYLIQNGLSCPENPHWGSWGGRYALQDLGGYSNHYCNTRDTVVGKNGESFESNHATIWRWRDQYQNDFAARIRWTMTDDPKGANHQPIVFVNDSTGGPEPYFIEAEAGTEVVLDASKTYDPDEDDKLTFSWFQYKEPTGAHSSIWIVWGVPDLDIVPVDNDKDRRVVKIQLPEPEKCAMDIVSGKPFLEGMAFHIILKVTDSGTPSMTTYKRIVIQITNKELRGGRDVSFETNAQALGLV